MRQFETVLQYVSLFLHLFGFKHTVLRQCR